jgi:myo-inositol-1(or 4)-monophosphatase
MDLDHAHRVAVTAAEAAGTLLREGTRRAVGIRPKGDHGDVVTDLDLAAEKLLLERVQGAFPAHTVMAEESGTLGAPDGEWAWLIDPLDGTNNVAIGLPLYVVGLALCHRGVPELGVVHDPVAGQTWSAIRGRGALGPDGPLPTPPNRPLPHGPVVAWTQGYGVPHDDPFAGRLKVSLESRTRRLLQLWAPLLSWVLLARGDIDAIIGYKAGIVDLPAGMLIAQESGLCVHGLDGSPFEDRIDMPSQGLSFVAGRPGIVHDMLRLVTAARPTDTGNGEPRPHAAAWMTEHPC